MNRPGEFFGVLREYLLLCDEFEGSREMCLGFVVVCLMELEVGGMSNLIEVELKIIL